MLGVYTKLKNSLWPHPDNLIDGKGSVASVKMELSLDLDSEACACKTLLLVSETVHILHSEK